jgi:hypothetical protein
MLGPEGLLLCLLSSGSISSWFSYYQFMVWLSIVRPNGCRKDWSFVHDGGCRWLWSIVDSAVISMVNLVVSNGCLWDWSIRLGWRLSTLLVIRFFGWLFPTTVNRCLWLSSFMVKSRALLVVRIYGQLLLEVVSHVGQSYAVLVVSDCGQFVIAGCDGLWSNRPNHWLCGKLVFRQ